MIFNWVQRSVRTWCRQWSCDTNNNGENDLLSTLWLWCRENNYNSEWMRHLFLCTLYTLKIKWLMVSNSHVKMFSFFLFHMHTLLVRRQLTAVVFMCYLIVIYQLCAVPWEDCVVPGGRIWMLSHSEQMKLHTLRRGICTAVLLQIISLNTYSVYPKTPNNDFYLKIQRVSDLLFFILEQTFHSEGARTTGY